MLIAAIEQASPEFIKAAGQTKAHSKSVFWMELR